MKIYQILVLNYTVCKVKDLKVYSNIFYFFIVYFIYCLKKSKIGELKQVKDEK